MRYRLLIICTLITFIASLLITGLAVADPLTQFVYSMVFSILCAVSIFISQKVLTKRNASKTIVLLSIFFTVLFSFGGYLLSYITRQTVIDPSQVIYHTRLEPEKLTEGQLKAISRYVDEYKSSKEDVWFVRILYNKQGELNAQIFLSPQKQTERIRQGRYIYYYPIRIIFSNIIDRIRMFLFYRWGMPSLVYDYCQVSLKDKPFNDTLEVPSQDSLFPFETPKDFSEQEIIDIVDFYRSKPQEKKMETPPTEIESGLFVSTSRSSISNLVDVNHPIINIMRVGRTIKVQTGSQEGPLSGSGEVLEIQKNNDVYELIIVGWWNS